MLVNVNPFTNPQEMVYDLLVTEVFRLQKDIKAYGKKPLEKAIQNLSIASLKQLWDELDLNTRGNQTFEMILPGLSTSVSKIEVTMVNMKTKEKGLDRLDYSKRNKNGYRVIAVGGNSLSRGITLEGLCVSYFYRNTKMYDTLLQMGRWFGYRPGYEDLFKIWMGFEALEWFEFIHKACDDLRSEIAYMNKAEKPPKEFGLKVLNSPDTLMITAANKMRTASDYQQLVSLSGRLVESSWLSRKSNQGNLAMTQHFLRSIHLLKVAKTDRKPERYIGVDHDKVSGFISDFISHPGNLVFDGRQVAGYIQENSSNMQAWTVCVASGSMEERTVAGVRVNPTQRKMLIQGDCVRISGQKSRIGSAGATKILLSQEQIEEATAAYLTEPKKGKGSKSGKITVPDRIFLRYAPNPVLFIYFMQCSDRQGNLLATPEENVAFDRLGEDMVVGITLKYT